MRYLIVVFWMGIVVCGNGQELPKTGKVNLGIGVGMISAWEHDGFGNQFSIEYQKQIGEFTAWSSELRIGNHSNKGIMDAPEIRFTGYSLGIQGIGQLPIGPWLLSAELGVLATAIYGLKGGRRVWSASRTYPRTIIEC